MPEELICATVDPGTVYETASMLEAKGCGLYNIDLAPVRQYLLSRNLFPMIKLDGSDSQFAIDYELPPLVTMKLSVTPARDRGIATNDDPIRSITLGDTVLDGSDEVSLLKMVSCEVAAIDPDIIITEHGNSFDLPYLYHRATLHDVDLQFGREKDIMPESSGKSYFSYGRILYKPGRCLLSGRLHLDESSFVFREGGFSGLVDLARITGIPVQELSRLSPGSAVTALQVNQALRDGVLGVFSEAKNTTDFYMKIPETIDVMREYMRKVLEQECVLSEMVFKTRVSRGCDDYRQFNDRAAALRQYRQEDIEIEPGQSMRYIITDHRSKSYQKRVKIPELADKDTHYDGAKYSEYLLRAAESILLPFGYTKRRLDEIMSGNIQGDLYRYV